MMVSCNRAIETGRKAESRVDCALAPTYQSFFQLHLLYVLILLPRLRVLPATAPTHPHTIPEPLDPSQPSASTSVAHSESSQSNSSILTKPHFEGYPSELLNHFFELIETQMRRVLGRGERERVVKKYLAEMGEQWKGAGAGLDYAIGLSLAEDAADLGKADTELASWIWRNLLGSRGLGAPAPGLVEAGMEDAGFGVKEVDMAQQLETIVRFVRREMSRLDRIEDRDVIDGNIGDWGPVREEMTAL